ncbi:MAG: ABC transporter ATP-binding protein [Ignavibacteria bacterium]
MLRFQNISFSYVENSPTINNVTFDLQKGEFVSIVGRNGSGKSTLLKLACGLLRPSEGKILFNSFDILALKPKIRARLISYLPQIEPVYYNGTSVNEMLYYGRYAYKNFFEFSYNEPDRKAVMAGVNATGIFSLLGKKFNELSGGERQRVLVTMALIQLNLLESLSGKLLLVDEPTSFLDISYQYEIYEFLKSLQKEKGLSLITVTHDIDLALKFTEKTILLKEGKIVAFDQTERIFNDPLFDEIFGVQTEIIDFDSKKHLLKIKKL